jgi:hypothetical protein
MKESINEGFTSQKNDVLRIRTEHEFINSIKMQGRIKEKISSQYNFHSLHPV